MTDLSPNSGTPYSSRKRKPPEESPPLPPADSKWLEAATNAIILLCGKGTDFTSDDVWGRLSYLAVKPPGESRMMGNAFLNVQDLGLCEPLDVWKKSARPECHGRPVQVWRPVDRESEDDEELLIDDDE